MTIKEKPLINAVDRLGPSWSPSHPLLAGPWTVLLLALFGTVVAFFQAGGRGTIYWHELYQPMRVGVLFAFAIALFAYAYVLSEANSFKEEERSARLFVLSGIATMVALGTLDVIYAERIQDWMRSLPPITGRR